MKTLRLIFRSLRTSVLRKIVVMLFTALSVCTMNITLSGFQYQNRLNSTVKRCGLYDDHMFATMKVYSVIQATEGEERRFAIEKLNELRDEGVVESFCETASFDSPYSDDISRDRCQTYWYPAPLAYEMPLPVWKGSWFTKEMFEDESAVPIIVGWDLRDKFKLGQEVTLNIYGFTARVVGFLQKDALVLASNASGSGLDLNACFASGNDSIIFGTADKYAGALVIKLGAENREAARQRVLKEIGDAYYTFSFKDLSDKTYEDNRLMTEKSAIVFVISLIVCMVGVSSSDLINTFSQKKRYAVYFFCGMDMKNGVALTALENIIQLLLPAAAGFLAFLIYYEKNMGFCLWIEPANYVITALMILGIFGITSLKPLLDIKRTSPVRAIGET